MRYKNIIPILIILLNSFIFYSQAQDLNVNGNIFMPNYTGDKSIYMWSSSDPNWRIGMSTLPGFTTSMATEHVQFVTFGPNAGHGFAVGMNGGNSSMEITNMAAFFRGNVGIGTATPRGKFDVDGAGDIYLADDPVTGTTESVYLPGHIYIAPYSGSNVSYLQARRSNDTGTSALRIRTMSAGAINESMHIEGNGKVGIGTTTPDQLLTVNGTIHSKEVKVDLSVPAPDYVFEKEYKLPSLEELKIYIDQNRHLPEVPSAKEMEANGVQLGQMNMLLLKKIEELTLYAVKQNGINKELKEQVMQLQNLMKESTKDK